MNGALNEGDIGVRLQGWREFYTRRVKGVPRQRIKEMQWNRALREHEKIY